MKKILLTGTNSYVGKKISDWLQKFPLKYTIEFIGMRDEKWKDEDFSKFDVVCHVVGIAHMKETKKNKHTYYKINRDLTYEIARKAKKDGVKQFIFLSSMSVYGMETGVITDQTPTRPKTNYGKSKLQAEELIGTLADENFKIAIVRPPMIYGRDCNGNYRKLAFLAKRNIVFPQYKNKRSMIYIDNFSEFIRLLIDNEDSGMYFPQNEDYISTSELVREIAKHNGNNIIFTKLFNPIVTIGVRKLSVFKKVFGDLVYIKEMSKYESDYITKTNCETFFYTEGGNISE